MRFFHFFSCLVACLAATPQRPALLLWQQQTLPASCLPAACFPPGWRHGILPSSLSTTSPSSKLGCLFFLFITRLCGAQYCLSFFWGEISVVGSCFSILLNISLLKLLQEVQKLRKRKSCQKKGVASCTTEQ